ncbi:unnamed protein product [Discosporangium mesarthrocarpum]
MKQVLHGQQGQEVNPDPKPTMAPGYCRLGVGELRDSASLGSLEPGPLVSRCKESSVLSARPPGVEAHCGGRFTAASQLALMPNVGDHRGALAMELIRGYNPNPNPENNQGKEKAPLAANLAPNQTLTLMRQDKACASAPRQAGCATGHVQEEGLGDVLEKEGCNKGTAEGGKVLLAPCGGDSEDSMGGPLTSVTSTVRVTNSFVTLVQELPTPDATAAATLAGVGKSEEQLSNEGPSSMVVDLGGREHGPGSESEGSQ